MVPFTSARSIALLATCVVGLRKQRRAGRKAPGSACGEEPPCHYETDGICDGPSGGGHCAPCGSDGIYFWNATCDADAGSWKCLEDRNTPGYRKDMYYQDCPSDMCKGFPPANSHCVDFEWVCNDGYVKVDGICTEEAGSACGEEPPCHYETDGVCDGPSGGGHCAPCGSDGIYFWNATCDADAGSWKCLEDRNTPGYRKDMYYQDCPSDMCKGFPPANSHCIDFEWVCNDGYVEAPNGSCTPAAPAPTPPATGGTCCWGGCGGSCSEDGAWCMESQGNCEGNCGGTWCM